MEDFVRTWWPLAAFFVNAVVLWAAWSLRRGFVTKEQFDAYRDEHDEEHDALIGRLNAGDVRFTRLETILEHMPTKEDVDALIERLGQTGIEIAGLRGDIKAINAVIRAVQRDNDLLVEGHMEVKP